MFSPQSKRVNMCLHGDVPTPSADEQCGSRSAAAGATRGGSACVRTFLAHDPSRGIRRFILSATLTVL